MSTPAVAPPHPDTPLSRVATPAEGTPTLAAVRQGALVPPDPVVTLGQQVVRAVVALGALAVLAGVVYLLRFLITPIALAFLAFYVLNPIVNLMENQRVPRTAAVAICFGGLLAMVVGVGIALWPSLDAWLQQAPRPGEQSAFEIQLAARLEQWERAGQATYPQIDWQALFNKVRGLLDGQRRALTEGLPTFLMGIASSAGTFLLAPIIALFLLLDGAAMHRAVVSLVPNRHFELVLLLIHRIDRQIAFYLRGAASQSAIVALLLALSLWLTGMPNAVLFAVIFAVLNVIPLIGPVLGAAAGLLYAMMDPTAPSLGVLAACYGVVHAIDVFLIIPLVVGKNVHLHPLTIIVGITVGGALGGILGMLVVIPAIAVAKAVASTLLDRYRRRAFGV